jgi:hypothetical protein
VIHFDRSTAVGPRRTSRINRREFKVLTCAFALVLATAGCTALSSSASTPAGAVASPDPGCNAALKAVSTYGPRAVGDLAKGHEDINKALVKVLVVALDAAADATDQPADKQAISNLANAYDEFVTTTAELGSGAASALLKDTTNLDTACKN